MTAPSSGACAGGRFVIAMALCAVEAAALAESAASHPVAMPVDELKGIYLRCDHAASRKVLDSGTAVYCSAVAEQLRLRGFDGSFDRLLAWWRVHRHQAEDAAAPR